MSHSKHNHDPKTVEEDLSNITEEELLFDKPQHHHKFKKAAIIAISIFLLILLLSYFYLGYPLFHVLAGRIESNPLNNNLISVGNITVFIENTALNTIQTSYVNNTRVETSLCLIGYVDTAFSQSGTINQNENKKNYIITNAYTPVILSQSFNQVTFEPCRNDTIIMFHTHPYKSCLASDTDINTLRNNQLNNQNLLMIVMCEPNRFSVYG